MTWTRIYPRHQAWTKLHSSLHPPPALGNPQIFIASTTAFLTAGRFGLAPTAKKHTKAGLKLYDEDSEGLTTSDPGGAPAARPPNCVFRTRRHFSFCTAPGAHADWPQRPQGSADTAAVL